MPVAGKFRDLGTMVEGKIGMLGTQIIATSFVLINFQYRGGCD